MLKVLKKIPYKIDIFIFTTILSLSLIEWIHIHTSFYRAGLHNTFTIGPFYACYYEPVKIVFVILALIRIAYYFQPDKKFGKNVLILFFSISICIASWILPFFISSPGAVHFLKGFEQWIHKNVDINAIQKWIISEEAEKFIGERYSKEDFPDDLPNFIKNVNPEYVTIHNDGSEKGKCIEFVWTTLGGSWGIVVSPPTMKTKQGGLIKHSKSYYEYRRPIQPGVYIFNAG